MNKKMYDLTAIIELDEAGEYFAYCPELKYAYTSGKTVEEAMENLKDVVKLQKVEIEKEAFKPSSQFLVSRLQLAY